MTEVVRRKSSTQMVPAQLHAKFNEFMTDKQTVSLDELKSKLAEIKKELTPSINASEDKDLLKHQLTLIIKKLTNISKFIAGTSEQIHADDLFLNYYGGTPKVLSTPEQSTFDLIIERAPDDNVVIVFGQRRDKMILASEILSEAEHTYGVKCIQVMLWYPIDMHAADVLIEPIVLTGKENLKDTSTKNDIGRVSFDKSHKLKLNVDPTKNELSGYIREKFQTIVGENNIVTLYHDNYDHVVIAKINQILTHTMHTSTNFNSLTDLTVEIKMIPMKEKFGNELRPIQNKDFTGWKIRFPNEDEYLKIHGMNPNHAIPYGWLVLPNGKTTNAYFPYDPKISSLDKTFYMSKLLVGLQNAGKTNAIAFDVRVLTTSNKIPDAKKPAVIIIDGENSFLNFPKIDEMIPETQKYMKENGFGNIRHQVFSVSDLPGIGNANLSFSELDVSAWHMMLPSLRANTEGQLITIMKMTLNYLEKQNMEPTMKNIRLVANGLAQNSNVLHTSQVPAIARALESPELSLFDDDKNKTVLNPSVLFKPGTITTIDVNGMDMSRRRVVVLYLMELLHRYKVLNRIDEPGIIMVLDESEQVYPKHPTKRESEYVDRIIERSANVVELGRKRYYGCIIASHRSVDTAAQIVQLSSTHMAFRCSGGENAHITKYFGIQNIPEINNLETGYARLKTNTSTADHGDINATIKIPFVGFANELLTDVSTDNENLGESKHA